MPVKRYRKRASRVRRVRRSYKRVHRAPRSNRLSVVHNFKRITTSSAINANSGFDTNMTDRTGEALSVTGAFLTYQAGSGAALFAYMSQAIRFCIADLPDVTDYSNLFDQYRINWINVKVWNMETNSPVSYQASAGTSGTFTQQFANSCICHSVLDYDDATPFAASEAGLLQMMERQGYRSKRFSPNGILLNRTWKPRHLEVISSDLTTGTTGRALAPRGQWLDFNQTTIPHFGLKWIIEMNCPDANVNSQLTFRMLVTYGISCRGLA